MATENTKKLLEIYSEKFLKNTLNVSDISYLNSAEAFPPIPGEMNSSAQMQDFVSTIGDLLSEDVLHQLVRSFVEYAYNELSNQDKNRFMRNTTLEKVLLAYEYARFPKNARAHRQEKLRCNLMKMLKDPTEHIEETLLKGKSGYVLYDQTLYYVNEQGGVSLKSNQLESQSLEMIQDRFPEDANTLKVVLDEEDLKAITLLINHVQNPIAEIKENDYYQIELTILKPIVELLQKTPPMYSMNNEMILEINDVPEEHRYIYDFNNNTMYYQGIFDKKPEVVEIINKEDPKKILPEKLKNSYQEESLDSESSRNRFSLSIEEYSSMKKHFVNTNSLDYFISLQKTDTLSTSNSNNKKTHKKSSLAPALGVVIGALGGAGAAVLITFLSGGFALPVLAIIAIAVGAALLGGLIGGGIGFFAAKQSAKKKEEYTHHSDFKLN